MVSHPLSLSSCSIPRLSPMKMRIITVLLLSLSPLLVVGNYNFEEETERSVVVLSDDTFEHQTQASTGQTTGVWFVKFYAPWCGHCKRLEPIWEELGAALRDEQVIVAKVDGTEAYNTMARFRNAGLLKGFPTLLLFRDRKVYKYSGKRTLEELQEFALTGYKSAAPLEVPGMLGFMDTFLGLFEKLSYKLDRLLQPYLKPYLKKVEKIFYPYLKPLLMKFKSDPSVLYITVGILGVIGLFAVSGVSRSGSNKKSKVK